MRISDWSSDVCSSDLLLLRGQLGGGFLLLLLLLRGALALQPRLLLGFLFGAEPLLLDAPGFGLLGGGDTGLEPRQGRMVLVGLLDQRVQALGFRSEEHTSELQSLMRTSYAVFCLKKKKKT